MRAVLRTIAQCHSQHLLHRDIKPGLNPSLLLSLTETGVPEISPWRRQECKKCQPRLKDDPQAGVQHCEVRAELPLLLHRGPDQLGNPTIYWIKNSHIDQTVDAHEHCQNLDCCSRAAGLPGIFYPSSSCVPTTADLALLQGTSCC